MVACGFCHRADGSGGPENSSLGGLPEAYIAQQMADFRSGARATSVPERDPPRFMCAENARGGLAPGRRRVGGQGAAYAASLKP